MSRTRPPSSPRITFSVTENVSTRTKCWCTIPTPRPIATRGVAIFTSLPRTRIRPLSAGYIPYSTRMSVDLPAPFSPTSACTSPRRRSTVTSSLATTPGNRFVMCSRTTSGAPSRPASSRSMFYPALSLGGRLVRHRDRAVDDLLLRGVHGRDPVRSQPRPVALRVVDPVFCHAEHLESAPELLDRLVLP